MKFSLGLAIGAAAGGYVIYSMSPEQRERVARASAKVVDSVKSSGAVRSVTRNVSNVGGAASDRIAGAVDHVGDAVTSAVAADRDDEAPVTSISGPAAAATG